MPGILNPGDCPMPPPPPSMRGCVGSDGISGVVSKLLPGVPEDDLGWRRNSQFGLKTDQIKLNCERIGAY